MFECRKYLVAGLHSLLGNLRTEQFTEIQNIHKALIK